MTSRSFLLKDHGSQRRPEEPSTCLGMKFRFLPVGVFVDDLIEVLKCFSFHSEYHGCAYSSVLQSIHGNLVIWYGAWIKRSNKERKSLEATLISALTNVSSMAMLVEYGFFDTYAGESKDGLPVAKFTTSDTISMGSMLPSSDDLSDLSYASLAVLKSCFLKMDGASSVVCFRSYDKPRVGCLHVWKSLHSCYSWLLGSDYRNTMSPYVNHLSIKFLYDIFRVVYVSNDNVLNIQSFPPRQALKNSEGCSENGQLN
ncbi:uncharacterized protein LOC143882664 isoform X1 [Tasmannia lanceolata]|uniref:uncharacterized protein LOC143882664 isoform X1 n=1 Tax=Tasmannia lanceolata TaxID=3420 RepID=UPI0040632129